MTTEVIAAPLGELRAISTAGGGTALTTTATTIGLPKGTKYLALTARNFATAVVAKIALTPFLFVLKTTDALVAAGNLTDASDAVQDGDTSTTLSLNSLGTAAQGDFLYVGSHLPFRGCRVDVGNTNSNASVLTVKYWDGNSWEDISDTDGTTSGGATFAQDGLVTWTIPADWAITTLIASADSALPPIGVGVNTPDLYWTRWEVSAALDASVTVLELHALCRSTAYAELLAGQTLELTVSRGVGGVGAIEALTDAGTGNLIVNAGTRTGRFV